MVMSTIPLRKSQATVETLQRELSALVALRQELRTRGEAGEVLEQNRVEIARCQWQLSYALIERYLPQRRAA
jgi:hypothetical protein